MSPKAMPPSGTRGPVQCYGAQSIEARSSVADVGSRLEFLNGKRCITPKIKRHFGDSEFGIRSIPYRNCRPDTKQSNATMGIRMSVLFASLWCIGPEIQRPVWCFRFRATAHSMFDAIRDPPSQCKIHP